MQKYLFAFIRLKEAEALLGIIKLHFACRHGVLLALVTLCDIR